MDQPVAMPRMRRALCVGLSSFGSYEGEPPTDSHAELPYAAERASRLAESLTHLGYSCTKADCDALPTADALGAAVMSAIDVGHDGDVQVIHVLSHGHLAPSSVYVLGADGDYVDRTSVAAWVAHIEDSPHKARPHTLFLLDICHAGAAARLDWLRAAGPGTRAWVIAATPSDSLAYDGRLTQAAANVLMRIHTGELDFYPSEFVPFGHVVEHIRREVVRLGGQNQYVCSTPVDGIAAPPFFPNKRLPTNASPEPTWEMVDVAAQPFTDLDVGLDEAHFLDRATGHSGLGASVDVGCFTGRDNELEALTAWLKGSSPGGLRVVTGGPGSGKSALLGIIVCAAHPQLRESTRRLWEHVAVLPERRMDGLAAIHLRELTIADALKSLIKQLSLPIDDGEATANEVVAAITALPSPPVIIVDALDEALTQGKIVQELLLPLAYTSRPDGASCCRLLVGMRPWEEFTDLHELAALSGGLIDLDAIPADVLRSELANYIEDLLSNAPLYAARRYMSTRRKIAKEIAAALTESQRERGGEFLAGALYTNWLLTRPSTTDEDAVQRIPRTVPDILELDLATQANNPWLRAVLTTLAHAHGAGMPATVIRRIAPLFLPEDTGIGARLDVTEFDLVLRKIRFYLRASPDTDGTTLYRLFHQSLADHLHAYDADLSALVDHLLATAPVGRDGTRRWDSAEPYVRRHAIQHAADASRLDELLHAESMASELAFNAVRTPLGRIGAAIYRESSERFGSVDLIGRRQLLAVNAARYGASEIASRLLNVPSMAPPQWWPQWSTGGQMASNPLAVLTGHADAVTAIAAIQVNGRPVAITASDDATLRIWDLLTRQPIGDLLVGGAGIRALACIELEGRSAVITGDSEGVLRVWDLDTLQPIGTPFAGEGTMVKALACTYLNSLPVAITSDGTKMQMWDLQTRKFLDEFTDDASTRAAYAYSAQEFTYLAEESFSPSRGDSSPIVGIICTTLDDISVAVSCSSNGMLRIWDLTSRELLSRISDKKPSGSLGLIGTDVAFGFTFGEPLRRPDEWEEAHPSRHSTSSGPAVDLGTNEMAAMVLDGQPLAVTGSTDGTLQAWNLSTREPLGDPIVGHTGGLNALTAAVLDDQPVAVTGSTDGTLQAWNLSTREPLGDPLTGHTGWANATAIALVETQPVTVAGSTDGTIRIWNLSSEKQIIGDRRLGHLGPINSIQSVSLEDRFVAVTCSDDGTIRTWDAKSREPTGNILGRHAGPVKAMACAMLNNRPIIVTGSEDRTVRLWEIYPLRQQPNRRLLGPVGPVSALECITVNKRPAVIAGTAGGRLHAWDLSTGSRILIPFDNGIDGVKTMACTYLDEQPIVIIVNNDGEVQAWSLETGSSISGPPTGAPAAVNAIACCYLNDRPVVVTGCTDGKLRIRDLPELRHLRYVSVGDSQVTALKCSARDGHPATIIGSADGSISTWDMSTDSHHQTFMMPREVCALDLTLERDLLVGFGWELAYLRNMQHGVLI